MSSFSSRAFAAALLLAIPTLPACDGCFGGDKDGDLSAKKASAKKKRNKKGKGKGKNKKKQTQHPGSSPRSGAAVAVQVGDNASLWTEGRTGALGRKVADISWTSEGFEWESMGGRQVLAPGGALYYRFTTLPDARPLTEHLANPQPAPEGYELQVGAGRGGSYKLTLVAPGDRQYRFAMTKEAPKATTWFAASLPEGVRPTPKLAAGIRWPRDEAGNVTNGVPTGLEQATSTAIAQEKLDAWAPDLQKLTTADARIAWSTAFDLDSDKLDEAVVCMDKAGSDYSCFVVEDSAAGARYHSLGLPYTGGGPETAPLAVKEGAFHYLVWAGRPARSKDDAVFTGHAVYFDGGAFTVDLIR